MAICPKCGMKISKNASFCEECGYSIKQNQYNRPPPQGGYYYEYPHPPRGNEGTRSSKFKILVVVLIIIISAFAGSLLIFLWSGGTLFYSFEIMEVHIITDSSWNGTISDWDGSREISGYGNEIYHVEGGDVTCTIRGSSSTDILVVQIIGADEKILKEGSTTVPNGEVTVSYSF